MDMHGSTSVKWSIRNSGTSVLIRGRPLIIWKGSMMQRFAKENLISCKPIFNISVNTDIWNTLWFLSMFHPGVAENTASVGGPGSHWPNPQLTTADWSHLCHTSITLCLSQSVKRTILHPAIVSRGNPFNNDITSWAPNRCNIFCYPRVVLHLAAPSW